MQWCNDDAFINNHYFTSVYIITVYLENFFIRPKLYNLYYSILKRIILIKFIRLFFFYFLWGVAMSCNIYNRDKYLNIYYAKLNGMGQNCLLIYNIIDRIVFFFTQRS